MSPINTVGEVFEAMQKVKSGATAYCTNFFPVERKLQGWIGHGELAGEVRDGVAFFLRKDRDFWHFYFCAANAATLRREITGIGSLKTERVVVDVVGGESALGELLGVLEGTGFRRYSRLQRMARSHQAPLPQSAGDDAEVTCAGAGDRQAIMDLLECSFDRHADQLPVLHEIDAAIESKQMLAIKCDGTLAALLFFETQGFTSTIRYWVVGEAFRSRRFGAALMRHYLGAQSAVKRFVLWVVADNQNAVGKYQHYGYAADGLIDHVLANELRRQ